MRIHYLTHVPFEGLACIKTWADQNQYPLSHTALYDDEPLPAPDDFDWLFIMGGPMNIYEHDKYPWLKREKRFINEAIEKEKTIIGICLGAQLLADVLGGPVRKNRFKEIGWYPVEFTRKALQMDVFDFLMPRMEVFHWHGDTFDLPASSVRMASGEACENQGFIYGDRIFGFQFHLEMTPDSTGDLIKNCMNEMVEAPFIQKPGEILMDENRFQAANTVMNSFLDRLRDRVG